MVEESVLLIANTGEARKLSRSIVERSSFDVRSISSLEQAESSLKNEYSCLVLSKEFEDFDQFVSKYSGSIKADPSLLIELGKNFDASKAFDLGFDDVVGRAEHSKYQVIPQRISNLVENQLKLEEKFFNDSRFVEKILNTVPVGMYIQNSNSEMIWANSEFKTMIGISKDSVKGFDYQDSNFTREQIEKLKKADRKALEQGKVDIPEINLKGPSGESKYYSGVKKSFSLGDSDEKNILGVSLDITDRKKKENALEETLSVSKKISMFSSREKLGELAVETLKESLDMKITAYLEKRGNKLVPVSETQGSRQIIGKAPKLDIDSSLAGKAFQDKESKFFEDLSEVENLHNSETPMRSEVIIPLGVHGVLISGSAQKRGIDKETFKIVKLFASLVEAGMDRAQREDLLRKKEETLRVKNEKLNKFASLITHDLRNPLNVAEGYLDIAEETGSHTDFEEVRSALTRMDDIVENVLKITKEDKEIDLSDFSLREVAKDAWSFVEAEDSKLRIADDVGIYSDKEQVQQILENLFSNSIEHNQDSVTVEIGSTEKGFYVEDDGKGVSQNNEEIFKYGKSEGGSTGLGLSIVKNMVRRLGWEIRALESDEGGLRFEFEL